MGRRITDSFGNFIGEIESSAEQLSREGAQGALVVLLIIGSLAWALIKFLISIWWILLLIAVLVGLGFLAARITKARRRRCFSFDRNLKKIKLHDGFTCIEQGAFHGCCNLIEIYIPMTVTEITDSAFSD